MKAIIFSLIILSYFGITDSFAQQKSNDADLEAVIFGLLKNKHNYEELMSKKTLMSIEERKTQAASELIKSEYGASLKIIRENAAKYLAYIERAIKENAETLNKEMITYEKIPVTDSGRPNRYVISKLDYLKAVKYSLFEQKSNQLLHLYQIPDIRLKYGPPKTNAIRPK